MLKNMTFLGKGTYGSVSKKGDYARKKFHKISHLIQEYMAIRYLNNVHYIVKCHKVNFDNYELYMELHQMNMRDWLNNNQEPCKPTFKNKMKVLNDILKGLYHMHKLDLVHGDLKPSNILIDCIDGKVFAKIADLGFVSIDKFAKVERTAELYRDINIHHDKGHDIYSLGIIMLEMFGNIKLKEQPYSYDYLHDTIIRKKVKNTSMAELIISMTQRDYTKRPDAGYILQEMFEGPLESVSIPTIEPIVKGCSNKIDPDWNNKVHSWMKYYADKYNLDEGRAKRGYYALLRYFADNNTDPNHYKLYMCTMLLILSSTFRKASVYKVENVIEMCQNYDTYTRSDVLNALDSLLENDKVITILMAPSSGSSTSKQRQSSSRRNASKRMTIDSQRNSYLRSISQKHR